VEGETISYTLNCEPDQAAGEYPITVTAGENPNYTVTVEDGAFTITPVEEVHVKITTHSGSFTYDAANHTVTGYDAEIDNPLYTGSDFTFSGDASVTAMNAGTYTMGLDGKDFTNNNGNFAKVNFEVVNEPLVITPKPVTITVDNKTKVYGDKDPALTAKTDGTEGTDTVVLTMSRTEGENVGSYTIDAKPAADPNYTFTVVPGTLTVTPKAVTVTADNKVKTFGGEDPELTAVITGLVPGDSAELITYTVSREEGEDTGTYTISVTGDEVQGNYTVTYVSGEMTVEPEDAVIVRITARNGSFLYDGTAHDLSGYDVEISNPLYSEESFTFTGSSDLKAVNAGTYRTAIRPEDFINNDPNFGNVVFQVTNGEMVITKRQVTLASANAEKRYDGTPLRNDTITVGGDGFALNEGLAINVTGQITEPGKAENTFDWTFAGNTLEANYTITKTTGTLTVLPGLTNTVTVIYQYEDGTVIKTVEKTYAPGQHYEIVSEQITGYKPDRDVVSGTMEGNVRVTVTYSQVEYTLTIRYVDFDTGEELRDPTTEKLHAGDEYRIEVPEIAGHKPSKPVVEGKMEAKDKEISVIMTGDEDGDYEPFPEPPTPLGISNAALGSGEIIE